MPLLRRAFALVLLLSVLLSTLGMTHARCPDMDHGQVAPSAMTGMEHGAGHHAPPAGRDHCNHGSGAPQQHGGDLSCLIVAHCATAMIATERSSGSPVLAMSGARAAGHLTAPLSRPLEPDSPPPRA